MDMNTHILVVDDDPGIREVIGDFLTSHGYLVTLAADGQALRAAIAETRFDLIVLDLMMPGEDGLTILRALGPARLPAVILLSVMGTDTDRIVGLEMGADDYLPKPCNPRELLARIRAVLRRRAGTAVSAHAPSSLRFAGWALDPEGRTLTDPAGEPIMLTSGEFRLLLAFAERPRRVLTRDMLLESSRGFDAEPFDRAIDVQISRLRRKLVREGEEELIRTLRNEGYLFTPTVTRS
ncbi:response regulator [Sphingobium boeckii]|uniref:Regulatory protein VirG n=1 Tax=Sphingobium boeckii TaxID=1082345 RepID=A0A7W9EEF2_9SPHN|nr:response regulator [Sphingobium boeckii]MBB5684621.1 two-component system OmpR family response regulator [Sphingobium boeckii]